jgi:hypothetical protein
MTTLKNKYKSAFLTVTHIIIFITCILFVNISVAKQSEHKKLFEQQLCLQVKFYQGQPLSDLQMVKKLGVKWVREEDKWHEIETVKGVYKPLSASLKARLAFYKENNIGVIFILAYENPVAYPNTNEAPFNFVNATGFSGYAEYMAKQLKVSGVEFVLELWNEPHNSQFASNKYLGGQWNGAAPSPWVDHYVKMVAQAVKRVKAVDPSIKVITNDDMWVVHYYFLDKGLPKAIDGFGVHPYSGGRPPEMAAVTYNADWTKPYQVVDKDQSFESAVRRLVEQGKHKLGKSPGIWITEWGWRVGEKTPDGQVISEERVASYLPRALILAAAAQVETACWFSAQDIGDGPMGLKTNDGRYRVAYQAFEQLSNTLGKTTFECELKQDDQGKRAFLFKGQYDSVIASWRTHEQAGLNNKVKYENFINGDFIPQCMN